MPTLSIRLTAAHDPKTVHRTVSVTINGSTNVISVDPQATSVPAIPLPQGAQPHVIVHDYSALGVASASQPASIPPDLTAPATPEAPVLEVVPDPVAAPAPAVA